MKAKFLDGCISCGQTWMRRISGKVDHHAACPNCREKVKRQDTLARVRLHRLRKRQRPAGKPARRMSQIGGENHDTTSKPTRQQSHRSGVAGLGGLEGGRTFLPALQDGDPLEVLQKHNKKLYNRLMLEFRRIGEYQAMRGATEKPVQPPLSNNGGQEE